MTTATVRVSPTPTARLAYVDNLRILMTALVILLHLSIGYGAPGDWYYNEQGSIGIVSTVVLTLFVAINQAFFMGFFFMISSYFSPASLYRKGSGAFLRDRLVRLGIPMALYALVVNPLFVAVLIARDGEEGYWQILADRYVDLVGFGPAWFLEALLLLSVVLVAWRKLRRGAGAPADPTPLGNRTIALFGLCLGAVTFIVRIWLPVGWWLEPFHFQLAHFPQYVALFAVGVVAHGRGWFGTLTAAQGRSWLRVALGLAALFPVLFVAGGGAEGDIAPFVGGLHWQQLAYTLWEQLMCVAVVVALLVAFRDRLNDQGRLVHAMSRAAYGTYVLHAPIITLLALALSGVALDLGLKFVLVAPLAVGASFLAGYLVKQLPVARDII